MEQKKLSIEDLITLAKTSDNIDFGMLSIDEDELYKVLTLAVCKGFNTTTPETRDIVYLASTINLQVRNFVLQQQNNELLKTISKLKKQLDKN